MTNEHSTVERRFHPTGLPGLDFLLGGGLPARQTVLLAGPRGAGKTVLSCQVAFRMAARGVPGTLVTLSAEPHQRLLESIEGFSFFDRERLGRDLMLLSAHNWLKRGAKEMRDVLLSAVREREARLLVVDGLHLLADAWRDPEAVRELVAELSVGLASSDCVGFFTAELSREQLGFAPEAAATDGLLRLSVDELGGRPRHRLEVVKVRGRPHVRGTHAVEIDHEGLHLFPRLETLSMPPPPLSPKAVVSAASRVSLGTAGLDALVGGGLKPGGAWLLCGPPGTGKTLMALQFLKAARGGRALYVAPARSEAWLMERLLDGGVHQESGTCGGQVELWAFDASRESADAVAGKLVDRLRSGDFERVALDGLGDLVGALESPERERDFVAALGDLIRAERVSALYTWEAWGEDDRSWTAPWAKLPESVRDVVSVIEPWGQRVGGTPSLRVVRVRGSNFVSEPQRLGFGSQGLELGGPLDPTGRVESRGEALR